MPTNSPVLAIPYVEPADALATYPTTDKAAKDRLDLVVPRAATGRSSLTLTAASDSSPLTVTFPAGRFSVGPRITATPETGAGYWCTIASNTSTSFALFLHARAAATATVNAHWLAIQDLTY